MWILTIWRLWIEVWTEPGCSGPCQQGRKECKCRKR